MSWCPSCCHSVTFLFVLMCCDCTGGITVLNGCVISSQVCRAAILDCRVIQKTCTGIKGNVFGRPLAQEGLSSTIFNNSKNLASSSQGLRPDTTETARKRDGEMKRESLNTSIPSPHFQSRSCMLNHIGEILFRSGI